MLHIFEPDEIIFYFSYCGIAGSVLYEGDLRLVILMIFNLHCFSGDQLTDLNYRLDINFINRMIFYFISDCGGEFVDLRLVIQPRDFQIQNFVM